MKPRLPIFLQFWPWGFVLACFLVLLLVIVAKPAYRIAKSWRAKTYLAQAEDAFKSGDFNLASQRAKLCVQFNNEGMDAYRILGRIADAQNDPQSLNVWTFILQSGKGVPGDRIALGEAALRENFPMVAARQLDILLAGSPSKEICNLAGLLAVRRQQPAVARVWFEKALALDPRYTRAELNLARVHLYHPESRKTQLLAIDRLRDMASSRDDTGLQSLRILSQWGFENPAGLPFDTELAGRLKKHPLAGIADRCFAAQWEMQAHPGRKDSLIAELTRSVDQLSPPDQRDLAAWLNRQNRFEKTVTVFPLRQKMPDSIALVVLDAMAALGQWQQIDDFLRP